MPPRPGWAPHGWERWKNQVEERIEDAEVVVEELKLNSHPPMPYIVCDTCSALVREGDIKKHMDWHTRSAKPQ